MLAQKIHVGKSVLKWAGDPMQGARVWSLVRELRSHVPRGAAKKLKNEK